MDPETSKKRATSEILTVMFIDIAGYTSTTTHLNRELFSHLHDLFDSISLSIFRKYAGKVIKKIGDAFLITFKSSTDAVLCGIELQNAFDSYNRMHHDDAPIRIRVALHTGEVLIRDGDVYGDAVNTAARMEQITKPGHVVFSEAVFLTINKNEIPFIHLGPKKFKGLKYPVRLFRVKGQYDEFLRRRSLKRRKMQVAGRLILTLILLSIIAVAVYYLVRYLVETPQLLEVLGWS